jgi:twitching motility two-component system response regulator PilG
MLNGKAMIGNFGVNGLNDELLSDIFNLAPDMNNIYHDPSSVKQRIPDIVFINADNAKFLQQWTEFFEAHQHAVPIMVTSADKPVGNELTVQLPITFKKVLYALKKISSTAGKSIQLESDTSYKKRILIVDDSLQARKYLEQKVPELLSGPLILDFAASGEEAAKKIQKTDTPYDLIFLDVIMPGANGYTVCKWIKEKRPCPVVMLTSRSSSFDKLYGSLSGCDAYLTKPPTNKQLKKVLKKCFSSQM